MNGRYGPSGADGWDAAAADAALAEPDAEPGVDAILRDDDLLDALGRGELPAHYRADVTARLITDWRLDLGEPDGAERPELTLAPAAGVSAPPRLATLPPYRGEETANLPVYQGTEDRIDESFRTAFVAAGYARPTDGDEPTQQFGAVLVGLSDGADEQTDAAVDGAGPVRRHVRPRRLDRIVVAATAAAAILAAGSAGSVAAAATAHPETSSGRSAG